MIAHSIAASIGREIDSEIIEQVNYGGPTAQVFYVAGAILVVGAALIWFVVWLRKRMR